MILGAQTSVGFTDLIDVPGYSTWSDAFWKDLTGAGGVAPRNVGEAIASGIVAAQAGHFVDFTTAKAFGNANLKIAPVR